MPTDSRSLHRYDMELSFVDVEDVLEVNERLLNKMFKESIGIDVPLPIQRMTYAEAMDRFGSDKPDIRFGLGIKEYFRSSEELWL